MKKIYIPLIALFALAGSRLCAQETEKIRVTEETVTLEPPAEEIVLVEEASTTVPDDVYFFVEENASFQGGDISIFSKWVYANLQYPKEAKDLSISGRVFLNFKIDTTGAVYDVQVIRSLYPACDEEAIRVISSSPAWSPAKMSGRKVRQQFTIPVEFKLD